MNMNVFLRQIGAATYDTATSRGLTIMSSPSDSRDDLIKNLSAFFESFSANATNLTGPGDFTSLLGEVKAFFIGRLTILWINTLP